MIKHLSPRKWGWINFKVAIGLWSLAMLFVPPTALLTAVGGVLHAVWMVLTFIGAVTSIIGMIMQSSQCRKTSVIGVSIETSGLALMIIGPFVYLTTQLGLLLDGLPESFTMRFALTFFAWAMVSAVGARLFEVIPRFRREAKDPTKKV